MLARFLLLMLLACASGWFFWSIAPNLPNVRWQQSAAWLGAVAAFSSAIVAAWLPRWSRLCALLFALASGVFVVGLSQALEARFPGVVLNSVLLTMAVFVSIVVGVHMGVLNPGARFHAAVFAATAAVAMVALVGWLATLLGAPLVFWPPESVSWLGMAVWYGFVALVAALNLLVDFDRLRSNPPHTPWESWYCTLAIAVSFVWMYVSFLRLLAMLRR